MLRNVTLTADETLIGKARERARRRHTTLNEEFREWLARYAGQEKEGTAYRALMEHLAYAQAGRKFDRDELNER
jgi:hypothetical protein